MTYKRLAALALALLCLTSCASMLERDTTYTNAHVENPPTGGDTAYRVETYTALTSALRNYVEEGMDEGSLRFPATYPGNLTVDLEKAKRQMMEEEPLGCYVLGDITFHINRIIAYYEVTAAFDYRIPPAEYMAMPTVRDQAALDSAMEAALDSFGSGFTVLLTLPGARENGVMEESIRRVHDLRPDLALGYPQVDVTYYPETGQRAVAEVRLTYSASATILRLRQRNMLQAARELAGELEQVEEDALYETLMSRWRLEPEGSSGADGALLDGAANQEGLDRAFALVMQYREKEGEETP